MRRAQQVQKSGIGSHPLQTALEDLRIGRSKHLGNSQSETPVNLHLPDPSTNAEKRTHSRGHVPRVEAVGRTSNSGATNLRTPG